MYVVPADFGEACDEPVEVDVSGLLGVELAEEALAQQSVQRKVLQEGLLIHTLACGHIHTYIHTYIHIFNDKRFIDRQTLYVCMYVDK